MLRHLRPVPEEQLADENFPFPVCRNVVSNCKLDPAQTIRLLRWLAHMPNAQIKSRFGAGIAPFTQALEPEQVGVLNLKPSSMTHLAFSTGALSGAGNRSDAEALLGAHKYRLTFYHTMPEHENRTNFRRWTIPNRVFTSALPYQLDLARMYASDTIRHCYEPDLFPGLFRRVLYTYDTHADYARRRIAAPVRSHILETDLVAPPITAAMLASGSFTAGQLVFGDSAHQDGGGGSVVPIAQHILDTYLPKEKWLAVLLFHSGRCVGLGISSQEEANYAFQDVERVARAFRVNAAKEERDGGHAVAANRRTRGNAATRRNTAASALGPRKRRARDKCFQKMEALQVQREQLDVPAPAEEEEGGGEVEHFSRTTAAKILEINALVNLPAAERAELLRQALQEDGGGGGKRKNKRQKKNSSGGGGILVDGVQVENDGSEDSSVEEEEEEDVDELQQPLQQQHDVDYNDYADPVVVVANTATNAFFCDIDDPQLPTQDMPSFF